MTSLYNCSPFRKRKPRNIFPYIRYATVRPPRKVWQLGPEILLRGEWLNEAGFHPDWRLKITVSDGKLVLEPLARPLGFFIAMPQPLLGRRLQHQVCTNAQAGKFI